MSKPATETTPTPHQAAPVVDSPTPEPRPYVSCTEAAALIRAALKARGWSSRKVSVRAESYSMGSSLHVVIKDASVPLLEVKAIAEEHERISYDSCSGEILSGGNRFVNVSYSHGVAAPLVWAVEARMPQEQGLLVEVVGFKVWREDRDTWRADPGPDRVDLKTYSKEMMARQIVLGFISRGALGELTAALASPVVDADARHAECMLRLIGEAA